MLRLLLLLLAAAAGAWFYPQMRDGADTPCAALERRFAALMAQEFARLPAALAGDRRAAQVLAQAQDAARNGTGAFGRGFAEQKFPKLPPDLACAAGWWQMFLAADLPSVMRSFVAK